MMKKILLNTHLNFRNVLLFYPHKENFYSRLCHQITNMCRNGTYFL